VSRSLPNRFLDFIGRSTLGMDNSFARHKRLSIALFVVGLVALLYGFDWLALPLGIALVSVVVVDWRRYNREHPNA
jgi:hypothetical protein